MVSCDTTSLAPCSVECDFQPEPRSCHTLFNLFARLSNIVDYFSANLAGAWKLCLIYNVGTVRSVDKAEDSARPISGTFEKDDRSSSVFRHKPAGKEYINIVNVGAVPNDVNAVRRYAQG
jgi:hypothetical protein